jgi:hypothetical protein
MVYLKITRKLKIHKMQLQQMAQIYGLLYLKILGCDLNFSLLGPNIPIEPVKT